MRLENIEGIKPQKDLVVVDIRPRQLQGLYLGGNEQAAKTKAEMYYGTVKAMGPLVDNERHCPGLNYDDIAIFSQFAGSYISTNDDKLYKIIRGYDIMATTTDLENINEKTLTPTADRILVSVVHKEVTSDGIYLDRDDARDPRLKDIDYGTVVSVGSEVVGFAVGDEVAYDVHVGEALRERSSDDEPELRVMRIDDVLFLIT